MSDTSIPIEKAKQYILSGKAVVIFMNKKTGEAFKYRVEQDKKNEHLWWVNTFAKSPISGLPHRIGTITDDKLVLGKPWLKYPTKDIQKTVEQHKAVFKAMWQRIMHGWWESDEEEKTYCIMHDGTCGRCGRQLTDISSINYGIGPECRSILGIT